MDNQDLSFTFLVDQTPAEVYTAVNNVSQWWGEGIEGDSHHLNDEFVYRHKKLHCSRHKIAELVPNQKVVWFTKGSNLSFARPSDEWTGTNVIFEITEKDGKTQLHFTHEGLVPQFACFGACSAGWGYYLQQSLLPLITTGKGNPDDKSIATATE